MTMQQTYQGGYEVLAEATIDQPILDQTEINNTFAWGDKSSAYGVPEAFNRIEIIAESPRDATDGANASFALYGYRAGGPAEYLGDFSCTVGAAYGDNSLDLYVDTIVIAEQLGIANFSVSDSGNDRVAKLTVDNAGYSYIGCKWYDVSGIYRALITGY